MEADRGNRVVLVAIDADDASHRVVEFVNRFFADIDMRVIGMTVGDHADPPIPMTPGIGTPYWPVATTMAAAAGDAEAPLRRAMETAQYSGLHADTTVVDVGDPVVRICQVARECHADLIVVGDSHRSAWARMLRGDLVDDVRHAAPCPVLVVP